MSASRILSAQALSVLSGCVVNGNVVTLPSDQLPRKLYEEVDLALRGLGGKWNRAQRGHVFAESEADVRMLLEGCLQTGLAEPLHPNGYFPTPKATAEYLATLANIQDGMTVLEPSAGEGGIAHVIAEKFPASDLTCVEVNPKLAKNIKNGRVITGDFFAHGGTYDRVVMNPPFEFLRDIDHVNHAFAQLRDGGRLVSVMSHGVTFRREKKAAEFRELVAKHGRIEPLPAGSFKHSGTMVNTIVVILDRPEATHE